MQKKKKRRSDASSSDTGLRSPEIQILFFLPKSATSVVPGVPYLLVSYDTSSTFRRESFPYGVIPRYQSRGAADSNNFLSFYHEELNTSPETWPRRHSFAQPYWYQQFYELALKTNLLSYCTNIKDSSTLESSNRIVNVWPQEGKPYRGMTPLSGICFARLLPAVSLSPSWMTAHLHQTRSLSYSSYVSPNKASLHVH